MRKNGVNKELRTVDGGVCAPNGFRSNGVCAEIAGVNKRDFALVVGDKRYPTAYVCNRSGICGAPVAVTQRHLTRSGGYAQAVVINSGVANVFFKNGEALAESVCELVGECLHISKEDVLIASTGRTDAVLPIEPFQENVESLCGGLEADEVRSGYAAEAIATETEAPKQLSFAFDLGDYPCKIGAIFKGNARVCPNMATFLAIITTDVDISPKMLQQALSSATKDVFNLMETDGLSSPNDSVFIMASGKAGNYKISVADSEYKKFLYALEEVAFEICKRVITDGNLGFLTCNVSGAKSKQIARSAAKSVLSFISRRLSSESGIQREDVLYAILAACPHSDLSSATVLLKGEYGTLSLFDEGKPLSVSQKQLKKCFLGRETELFIHLGEGNFASSAYGRNALFQGER